MQPKNLIIKDNSKEFFKRVESLQQKKVYVGIPEQKSSRRGDPINNAQLAFILTHGVRSEAARAAKIATWLPNAAAALYLRSKGSPLWRIPPRPIIEPAIEASDNKEAIASELAEAAKAALEGDEGKTQRKLKRAGLEAQNRVRGWFTDGRNNWPPNAPSTIKRKGSDQPNIDQGELRKAITFVVKE